MPRIGTRDLCPGSPLPLSDPGDLIEGHGDVMLVESEEAAHADHHDSHVAFAIDDEVPDLADALVIAVVDVKAAELRSAPFTGLLRGRKGRGVGSWHIG